MKDNVYFSLELGKIINALQLERGVTALYINSGKDTSLMDRLNRAYQASDEAVQYISRWTYVSKNSTVLHYRSRDTFFDYLLSVRERRENMSFEDTMTKYTDMNRVFIRWMVNAVRQDTNNDYWADIVAYHMLINGTECTGIERAIGTFFFTNGVYIIFLSLKISRNQSVSVSAFSKEINSTTQTIHVQSITLSTCPIHKQIYNTYIQYKYTIQIYNTNIQYKYTKRIYNTNIQYEYTIRICNTNIQYEYAIRICNTNMQYKYAIQIYNTNIQYKYTIQIYNTNIQNKYTIQIYNTNIQYKYTIQIYNTNIQSTADFIIVIVLAFRMLHL